MPIDIYKELGETRLKERLVVYNLADFVVAIEDRYTDEEIVAIVRAVNADNLVNDFYDSFDDAVIFEVFREIGDKEAHRLGIQEAEFDKTADQRRDAEDAEYEMTRTLHDEQAQKYGEDLRGGE